MADNDNIQIAVTDTVVDAVSPKATVTRGEDSATITITDVDGTTTATIYDGADGADGNGIASITVDPDTYHLIVEYTDGTEWESSNSIRGAKGDTGSTGAAGVGIDEIEVDPENYHLKMTLTDGTEWDSDLSIRGEQGEIPDFSIGTVTTLAAGSDATATITGTTDAPVLNLGIPKGADGSVASTNIAATYSSSATYAVGDYCWYSGALYRCTTAITTAEAWTSGHWTQVALADDLNNIDNAIGTLTTVSNALDDIDLALFTQSITSGVWRNDKIYPAGFVKNVTGKITDSSSQGVILVFTDPTTNKVLHTWWFAGQTGTFTLPLNITMQKPFGIGIYCSKLGARVNANVTAYRSTVSSAPVGTDVTGTNVGNYELGLRVQYKNLVDRFAESVSTNGEKTIIYAQNTLDSFTNSILSGWWWTEYQYSAGYIDHVTLKAPTNGAGGKCGVMVIDAVTNVCLFLVKNYVYPDTLVVDIPVHVYSSNPVYIACTGAGYISVGDSVQYIRYQGTEPAPGETITFTWTGYATYKFGVSVTYAAKAQPDMQYCKTRRRMFICGDSITAGYPFVSNPAIPGLRYGEAISRFLDYDVTFGAQSGNGWLYSSGSAYAYSITNATDFSQFDVALYAWGTNDFYHDMELGNITDTYASQTVCGTMNYCIDKIYTDNPTAVVIISTPLNRTYNSGYGYDTANAKGYTLKQMVDKMIELCKARGVMFIDNTCSPFNPKTIGGLTGDGLHPNRIGYQVLGAYMSAKVGALIQPYISTSKGL